MRRRHGAAPFAALAILGALVVAVAIVLPPAAATVWVTAPAPLFPRNVNASVPGGRTSLYTNTSNCGGYTNYTSAEALPAVRELSNLTFGANFEPPVGNWDVKDNVFTAYMACGSPVRRSNEWLCRCLRVRALVAHFMATSGANGKHLHRPHSQPCRRWWMCLTSRCRPRLKPGPGALLRTM